jgi:beta-hydroxylase
MKWLIPGLWLVSILYGHYRGRVRLAWSRVFLDHSVLLAPVNAFMVLASRVPTTPYVSTREIPELQVLQDHWEIIRAASRLRSAMMTSASIRFSSTAGSAST